MNNEEMSNQEKFITLPIGAVPETEARKWDTLLYYMEPILPLYQMEGVTEIMVNNFDDIYIEQYGKKFKVKNRFATPDALYQFIRQAGNALNQPFDEKYPILHARFPDCSRLCCTHSLVSPGRMTVTLRIAPKKHLTSADLLSFGALTEPMLEYIRAAVERSANIAVSGRPGSGKTTILRMMVEFIDSALRLLVCEDTQELFLTHPNSFAQEAPKRRDGVMMDITLSTLIETTLRQAPDRIWVGEIRDASALSAFLQAMTAYSGCATTIHSTSCESTLVRMQYLLAHAGLLDYSLARKILLDSIDVLIHVHSDPVYGRKIVEISEVRNSVLVPVFGFKDGKHFSF